MNKTVQIIAGIISLAGIVVVFGWFLNIDALIRVRPGLTAMRLSTAVSFILTGILIYSIKKHRDAKIDTDFSSLIISFCSLPILLIMILSLISNVTGMSLGIERLFVREINEQLLPAMPTMFNFVIIGFLGILTLFKQKWISSALKICGAIIILDGLIGILGFILNNPELQYIIKDFSGGIALHTSILFVLAGISLIFAGEKNED